jgi:hypothetical protein
MFNLNILLVFFSLIRFEVDWKLAQCVVLTVNISTFSWFISVWCQQGTLASRNVHTEEMFVKNLEFYAHDS